jgi:microcystin-dependent protein
MSDPFVAEIRILPTNFAPKGWAFCDGQILPLSQNTALFSLLGTTYGGDGKSNFALPDMQGNTPMGWGQGSGLSDRFLGEAAGEQFVTLLQSEMPSHNHGLQVSTDSALERQPGGQLPAVGAGIGLYEDKTDPAAQLAFNALPVAGSSFPHNNMQPYLVLNFCIALVGIYPARS